MERTAGHIAILFSCLIFSTNIIVTDALTGIWLTPLGYTLTRLIYGTIALWGIGLFLPSEEVALRDLGILAIGGLLGLVVSQLAFAASVQFTSPINFSLIMAMVPVMVLLLSLLFLGEILSWKKLAGIALSVIGAVIIIRQKQGGSMETPANLLGISIAFLSMASYAGYLVITRHVTQKYRSVTILKWMFLFSVILLLPFTAGVLPEQRMFSAEVTTEAAGQLLFILIFDGTLVYFSLLIALNRLKATTVSTYLNFLPVFTSVIAIATGQGVMTIAAAVAIALVTSGVLLVTRSR